MYLLCCSPRGSGPSQLSRCWRAVQAGASDALASVLVAIASVISILCTVPVGGAIDRLGDRSQGRPAHLGESLGHEHRMGIELCWSWAQEAW